MWREEDAEKSGGTQWPMGVMVATLVLLSAPAGRALDSHHICPTYSNSIKLFPYETAFFGTNKIIVRVNMKAVGCGNDIQMLNLWDFTVSNETSWSEKNLKWYEFNFISCGNFVAKIGSKIVKFKLSQKCINKPVTLISGSDVWFGRKCPRSARGREVEQSKAACKTLEGVPDTGRRLITKPAQSDIKMFDLLDNPKSFKISDLFLDNQQDTAAPAGDGNDGRSIYDRFLGGQQEPKESKEDKSEDFLNWPYKDILQATPAYNVDEFSHFDSDTGFSKVRNYKENAIPIFIGIVLLTVSMCLRFCLCRGKSVVRRVTTVTVIRSRPVGPDASQDHQDPPPSYIDVVSEATSPQSPANESSVEPPPPAYADIVDEVLPPTYSEVEAQSMPTSEEAPLADQEAEAHTTQPPSDPESAPDAKGSAPSKNMLSKYRSQQKQFAFKVLEEDE